MGEDATKEANRQVKRVLEEEKDVAQQKKRKVYTSFIDVDRAARGKYAAENGNIRSYAMTLQKQVT